MVEELTPQIVSVGLLLLVLAAPALTAVLSAAMVWVYRRAVLRAMAATAGDIKVEPQAHIRPPPLPDVAEQAAPSIETGTDRSAVLRQTQADSTIIAASRAALLYQQLRRAPWRGATRSAIAGAAFALAVALAAISAFPAMRAWSRFLLMMWAAAWPIVVASR